MKCVSPACSAECRATRTLKIADGAAAVYQIKRGKSTEEDVVRLLGPPSGRAIHPFTARPGDEVLEYFNFEWNTGRGQHTARKLAVFLGTDLVVQDYHYDSSTEAIQRPAARLPTSSPCHGANDPLPRPYSAMTWSLLVNV